MATATVIKKRKKVINEYDEKFKNDEILKWYKQAEKVLRVSIKSGKSKYDLPTLEEILIESKNVQYNT